MHFCVLQIVTQINWFHPTLANFSWSTMKVWFKKTTVRKPEFWAITLGKVERTVQKTAQRIKEEWQYRKRYRWTETRLALLFIFFASEIPIILPRLPCSGTPVRRRLLRRGACLLVCVWRGQAEGLGACWEVEGGLWNSLHSCWRAHMSRARHKSAVSRAEEGLWSLKPAASGSRMYTNVRLQNGRRGHG